MNHNTNNFSNTTELSESIKTFLEYTYAEETRKAVYMYVNVTSCDTTNRRIQRGVGVRNLYFEIRFFSFIYLTQKSVKKLSYASNKKKEMPDLTLLCLHTFCFFYQIITVTSS